MEKVDIVLSSFIDLGREIVKDGGVSSAFAGLGFVMIVMLTAAILQ